jgi:hypothetical protein
VNNVKIVIKKDALFICFTNIKDCNTGHHRLGFEG